MALLPALGCERRGPARSETAESESEAGHWELSIEPTENPEAIFRHLIADPIPEGITHLQGGGYQWQGHSVWLRFTADGEAISSILSARFERCGWEDVRRHLENPGKAGRFFEPPWTVDVESTEFYIEDPTSNDWTHQGINMIGASGSTVFFFGHGA